MIKHEKGLRKEQGDVESNDSENIISQQRQEVKNQESKEVEALQEGQTWQKQSRSRGEKMQKKKFFSNKTLRLLDKNQHERRKCTKNQVSDTVTQRAGGITSSLTEAER